MNRIDELLTMTGQVFVVIFVHVLKFVFWLPLLTVAVYEGRVVPHEKCHAAWMAGTTWMLCLFLALGLLQDPRVPAGNAVIFMAALHYALGCAYLLSRGDRARAALRARQA